MKRLLIAVSLLASVAFGQTGQPPVRYITGQQVKVFWFNKLPNPNQLDANFHQAKKARETYVAEVRAGKHDTEADKVAAQYNREQALKAGDTERAKIYESEITRLESAQQAATAEVAAKRRALRLDSEFASLRRSIDDLNLTLMRSR